MGHEPVDEPVRASAAVVMDAGVAGGSARRIADRQQAKREQVKRASDDATLRAHPKFGGSLVRARDLLAEPAPPTSWQKGAAGEEAVGRTFEQLADEGFVVLHDRRRPGRKSNIDHIVIGPRGVYVIDAKHFSGLLEIRKTGSVFRPGPNRVFVRGRAQDKRLSSMDWQVQWVREAVGADVEAAGGLIKPVLCFLGVELGFGQRAAIAGANDVLITWPRRFVHDVSREGPLSRQQVDDVARKIATALPAAVSPRPR